MKTILILISMLVLTACEVPEEPKVEAQTVSDEENVVTTMPVSAQQDLGLDGVYLYHTVICKNQSLTTTKLYLNLNTYEEIEIAGGGFYSKIGYANTSKYIEVTGFLDIGSTSVTFSEMKIVSTTDSNWRKLSQYIYGLLNYPAYAGLIDIGVGYKFPDVTYSNISQDNDGNLLVELPAEAYKYYATYYNNPAASDRCFMNYERKF